MIKPCGLAIVCLSVVACASEPRDLAPTPEPRTTAEGPCVRNAALFIVDGERVTAEVFDGLDTNEIESVSVLLAPTAVPRFGPDASCGAIMITTK